MEHRRKGLLWYPTYRVAFSGRYLYRNAIEQKQSLRVHVPFPARRGLYVADTLNVNGRAYDGPIDLEKGIQAPLEIEPGEEGVVEMSYRSQGMTTWTYGLGKAVSQARNFSLRMTTDFYNHDFLPGTLSPTDAREQDGGWALLWNSENLISGFSIGLVMPQRLNPGPLASRITHFAPVSLLFFVTVLMMFSVVRGIRIHPMNYFFLAAGFFAFPLLFAYLVDVVDVHLAFGLSAATSVCLVVGYLRLVVNVRFALVEAGLAQAVFLVLFSYSFFFKGYTGLSVSVGAVITLAFLMQLTARIDWKKTFQAGRRATTPVLKPDA